MTASLPFEVQQVFDRFLTTELVTVDDGGQPSSRPVTPRYEPGASCIEVSGGEEALGGPAGPKVALLFCDAAGSGLDAPPQVLVQGIADVESRIRPERVYVWPAGDPTREPQLFDAHMEEVRSGHDEEPDADVADIEGGPEVWDRQLDELGARHRDGVLSVVAPDGFPFSVRMPIALDADTRRVRIASGVLGVPVMPGLACVTAEALQVHGDLLEEEGGWVVVPHEIRRDAN